MLARLTTIVRRFNHYQTLGIPALTEDPQKIKMQYRLLVKKSHPDLGGDKATFLKIQQAYEVLSDPVKKSVYDQTFRSGTSASATANSRGHTQQTSWDRETRAFYEQAYGHSASKPNHQQTYTMNGMRFTFYGKSDFDSRYDDEYQRQRQAFIRARFERAFVQRIFLGFFILWLLTMPRSRQELVYDEADLMPHIGQPQPGEPLVSAFWNPYVGRWQVPPDGYRAPTERELYGFFGSQGPVLRLISKKVPISQTEIARFAKDGLTGKCVYIRDLEEAKGTPSSIKF